MRGSFPAFVCLLNKLHWGNFDIAVVCVCAFSVQAEAQSGKMAIVEDIKCRRASVTLLI